MEIKGKIALVTGGGIRIGKEIRQILSSKGARVAIHYHHSKPETGEIFQADLNKPQEIEKLVTEVEKKLGPIDILINNASIFEKTPFSEITDNDWNNHLNINLKAPFLLSQRVAKGMLQKKSGKIINIADYMAVKPSLGFLPYSVSKAGLIALTKALAKELAPHVQVNAIAPGPTLPPTDYSEKQKENISQKILLGHWGDPKEIANTVAFLIEGTDFATGSTFFIDGGRLLV